MSADASAVPVIADAALPSTTVKKSAFKRVTQAKRAGLKLLPRRIQHRLRAEWRRKHSVDGIIAHTASCEAVLRMVIHGAAEEAQRAGRTRIKPEDVARAIRGVSSLARLFAGHVPSTSATPVAMVKERADF